MASGSQIYKPDEVHPPPIRFAIFLPYNNGMGWRPVHNLPPIQSIRLTIYEPDVRLSGSQISEKWELDGLIWVPTRNFKVT